MTFPHSNIMFEDATTTGVSDVIHTRRFRNERGIFFVQWNGSGNFDLELQVRPDTTTGWTNFLVLDERDMRTGALRRNFAEAVYHFPQVRAEITTSSGGSSISVWYID